MHNKIFQRLKSKRLRFLSGIPLLAVVSILIISADASCLDNPNIALESYMSDTKTIMKDFDYIIGPEDTLEVYVWRHSDLDKTVIVRPDGKITLPVIKEVYVNGLTAHQIDEIVTEKYKIILRNPQVSVIVKGFRSKKICILGEVMHPGIYPIFGRLTVLEAITQAKYDKSRSNLKSIMLIRRNGEKTEARRLNLISSVKRGDSSQNITLEPDDIVFVPSSFIAEVNIFIDLFFSKTKPVLDVYLAGWKAINSPESSQ